jgi:hypothetical protein
VLLNFVLDVSPDGVARPPLGASPGKVVFLRITIMKTALDLPRGVPCRGRRRSSYSGCGGFSPIIEIPSIHAVLPQNSDEPFSLYMIEKNLE